MPAETPREKKSLIATMNEEPNYHSNSYQGIVHPVYNYTYT